MSEFRERRASVSREEFNTLSRKVDELGETIEENTVITKDIRNIVGSFKVMMHIAKWVTAIAMMFTALLAVVKGVKS